MKKTFFLILLAGLTFSGWAQPVINDLNVEKRPVSSFHGIEVATGIELMLSQGTTEELAVSAATAEFRDRIVTKVENGILKIYYDSKPGAINKKREAKNLRAYVSCITLDQLKANTGAEVVISGTLKSSSLSMEANTGALVNGKVDIGTLKVEQNTGSKVGLSGKAGQLEVKGDTGSKFTGEELVTGTCNVSVSTGAKVSVRAEKELEAKASTGAQVRYTGAAVIRSVKANSGGTISRI